MIPGIPGFERENRQKSSRRRRWSFRLSAGLGKSTPGSPDLERFNRELSQPESRQLQEFWTALSRNLVNLVIPCGTATYDTRFVPGYQVCGLV